MPLKTLKLKSSTTSTVKTGDPASSPITTTVASDVFTAPKTIIATSTSKGVLSAATLPVSSIVGVSSSPIKLTSMISPSVSAIVEKMSSDSTFKLPSLSGVMHTSVLPSYLTKIELGSYGPQSSDDMSVMTKKLEPYEILTGISQERPEIVMMTEFKPLYDNDRRTAFLSPGVGLGAARRYAQFMTDAGRFFEVQMLMRSIRQNDAKTIISSLRMQYPQLRKQFTERRSDFSSALGDLNSSAQFLWGLVGTLERLKNQLDIRDDIHVVDLRETAVAHASRFTAARSDALLESLTTTINSTLPPTYTLVDVLEQLGYPLDSIQHSFSSTKLWMQLVLELKDVLRTHSLSLLDLVPVAQQADTNAVNITKSTTKRFEFSNFLPILPPIETLRNTKPSTMPVVVRAISDTYGSIYEDVHFKTSEMMVAALVNAISREFRYSKGLANDDVKKTLSTYYGYSVQDGGNPTVLDFVIGKFGNNISDFSVTKTNSLASVAQQQPASTMGVLTFESKYMDGDTGTLTPGSTYYVDSLLQTDGKKFETSKLEDLSNLMDNTYTQFGTVVDGLNLLSADIKDTTMTASNKFVQLLSNPRSLFSEVWKQFVTTTGSTLGFVNDDKLTSIFAEAKTNTQLRSALFMYIISRMTRAYEPSMIFTSADLSDDNTPTTTAAIDQIVKILDSNIPATLSTVEFAKGLKYDSTSATTTTKFTTSKITRDQLKEALRSGTKVVSSIQMFMTKSLDAFKRNNEAIVENVTRFGGHIDTVIMMSLFDLIVTTLSMYGNQRIIGTYLDKGTSTYTVRHDPSLASMSIREIDARLLREITLAQHIVYGVLNTTKKLSNSARNVVNVVNGKQTLKQLEAISALFDDKNMIQMLFSEQQIMTLASAVADLQHALNVVPRSGGVQGDVDGNGTFDADDEIRALDDSIISPVLRDAVLSHLSSAEYSTKKAYNKKILTIGIPLGFTRRLKQRIDISKVNRTSFKNKQSDIINVVVYKVNLQNQDIIYKPQKFLFELSRFPVRNSDLILPGRSGRPGDALSVIDAFPTRDASRHIGDGPNVEYRTRRGDKSVAFSDSSYSFLTNSERDQILRNHVSSYLWELYLRIMTGVGTADHDFDLIDAPKAIDQEFVKTLVDHVVHKIVTKKAKLGANPTTTTAPLSSALFTTVMSNRDSTSRSSPLSSMLSSVMLPLVTSQHNDVSLSTPLNAGAMMSAVTAKSVPLMIHALSIVSAMSNMTTSLMSGLSISKKLIQPKQFDRVFNIIIDPDDFEVDYEKTVKTPYGKQAFELMVMNGDIVPLEGQENGKFSVVNSSSGNKFRAHDRDKSEGDLTFEKYIVNVETHGEEVI